MACPSGVSACIVCGPDNPSGLHVKFYWHPERITASFTPRRAHQGYHGLMSGGLLAAIFDCLHYRVSLAASVPNTVTAGIDVQYRAPVRLGQRLRFEARLQSQRSRVVESSARALLPDGTVAAESTATYVEIPPERLPRAAAVRLARG